MDGLFECFVWAVVHVNNGVTSRLDVVVRKRLLDVDDSTKRCLHTHFTEDRFRSRTVANPRTLAASRGLSRPLRLSRLLSAATGLSAASRGLSHVRRLADARGLAAVRGLPR
eukprot:651371-Prymnesium_polylepis.1